MQPDFHQAQHIGRREEQQDALGNLVLAPRHTLYVLADGMGGQQGGQTAARAVVAAILDHFHRQNPPADSRAAENQLHAALSAANQALARILQSHPELDGMGSTLIALIADENTGTYSYISVGDSPLYLLENGRLRRINANHAFAEDLKRMIAAGEITAEEAERHPARHAVTSAVTGKDIAHTDCRSGSLNPGDTLLLASDGVQTLSDREIEDTLNAAADPEAQAQALISVVLAKQNPHQDNTSLILVRHPPPPAPPPPPTPNPPTPPPPHPPRKTPPPPPPERRIRRLPSRCPADRRTGLPSHPPDRRNRPAARRFRTCRAKRIRSRRVCPKRPTACRRVRDTRLRTRPAIRVRTARRR